jgi:2-methylcitrate dehydratase PrpD
MEHTADLTHRLGEEFATLNLCLKRFPVHMTAQTAVHAILELRAEHGFGGAQVDQVIVAGDERMATVNNIAEPTDIMMAQYSIPFCVALALFRDPRNPASFDEPALFDADIRAMCRRVAVTVANPPTRLPGASQVTVRLKAGRSVVREVEEFNGTPARPLTRADLRDKFLMLMAPPMPPGRRRCSSGCRTWRTKPTSGGWALPDPELPVVPVCRQGQTYRWLSPTKSSYLRGPARSEGGDVWRMTDEFFNKKKE